MNSDRRFKTKLELSAENEELRSRLAESEETLRAIRSGEVDALFVNDSRGHRVVTFEGAESAYRVLVEAMNEGAGLIEENGILLFCNNRLAALLNSNLENVMGASLFRFIAPADICRAKTLLIQARANPRACDISLHCEDRTSRMVQISLSPMQINGSSRIGIVITDLTERQKLQEELRSLSVIDELTGLMNRRGFLTVAQQTLNLAQRLEGPLLLVFADLDGMKTINDTLGHCEGDHALIDTAEILRKTYRDSDVIARLGGDEFAALAMGKSIEDAAVLARRLQNQIDAHNARGHRPYRLSVSVGVISYDAKTRQPVEDLLARADEAMYANKRRKYENAQRDSSTFRTVQVLDSHAVDFSAVKRTVMRERISVAPGETAKTQLIDCPLAAREQRR
jgi:diguanylate cyclase (GGDEF)-like protein/PAS domain S-box-containing protein